MRDSSAAGYQGLEARQINWPKNGHAPKAIIFLHEGLGSMTAWQDFPDRLCASCALPGLVYSRRGYGFSAPLAEPLTPDFLHLAATELDELLKHNRIKQSILVGHSDGASIAIIYASQPAQTTASTMALIAIAPHLFVEDICIDAINTLVGKVREKPERLAPLSAQHRDIKAIFDAWSGAWLSPEFHSLNLRPQAAAIHCPVLAVQGDNDQYGTLEQVRQLTDLAANSQLCILPGCRHSPHLEASDRLLAVCSQFIQNQ